MARTTINIDAPLLTELKRLQKLEGKSLGAVASELLAEALSLRRQKARGKPVLQWNSQAMQARVDLGDHEAIQEALDAEEPYR